MKSTPASRGPVVVAVVAVAIAVTVTAVATAVTEVVVAAAAVGDAVPTARPRLPLWTSTIRPPSPPSGEDTANLRAEQPTNPRKM